MGATQSNGKSPEMKAALKARDDAFKAYAMIERVVFSQSEWDISLLMRAGQACQDAVVYLRALEEAERDGFVFVPEE